MSLLSIVRIGIEAAIEQERPAATKAWGESTNDVLDALMAFPDALEVLTDLEWSESCPVQVRALLPTVASYVLRTEDLIPARDGAILQGSTDDAYMTFTAALMAETYLPADTVSVYETHRSALAAVLAREIREQLDEQVFSAVRAILSATATNDGTREP